MADRAGREDRGDPAPAAEVLEAMEGKVTRSLMPKIFTPCLTVQEPTLDGCAELNFEVNGNLIATTVVTPRDTDDTGWFDKITAWWQDECARKC